MTTNHRSTEQPKQIIALLGGAFNPPHEGHVYISEKTNQLFDIETLWWLVSYQHPQKSPLQLADFETRVAACKALTNDIPYITVQTIEKDYNTSYTVDTLEKLTLDYPNTHFIWMMGEDNFIHLHSWHRWESLLNYVSIMVFRRQNTPQHTHHAMTSCPAYHNFKDMEFKDFKSLSQSTHHGWLYVNIPAHPASSSAIREKNK